MIHPTEISLSLIAKRCAEIQRSWNEKTERKRRCVSDERYWTVPIVGSGPAFCKYDYLSEEPPCLEDEQQD